MWRKRIEQEIGKCPLAISEPNIYWPRSVDGFRGMAWTRWPGKCYNVAMPDVIVPDAEIARIAEKLKRGHYRAAFSSLRAMRRMLERVTFEAYQGQRPMRDLVAMSAALKTAAELFVAEKQLVSLGLDKEEDNHPLGHDGGLPEGLTPRGHVQRLRSYKKGTSARGTPVDEYKVTLEGGSPDDRPLLEQAENVENDEL